MSSWARNQIMAKNCGVLKTHEQFLKLNLKQLSYVLRNTLRPEYQIEFASALEENTKMWVSSNFELSILNYRDFYARLLVYEREFLDVYDWLATDTDEDIIPRVDNKAGGLMKIFVSNIPGDYGERVVRIVRTPPRCCIR